MSENVVSNIIDELQLQNSDEYKVFTISAWWGEKPKKKKWCWR